MMATAPARHLVQGVLIGTVTSIDPALGRVRVHIAETGQETDWAPIAAPMAGKGRGAYFMPEEGDEVVVGFDRGDFTCPYVIGFLWSSPKPPPRTDGQVRVFHSVNGHEIAFYDPPVAGGDQGYVRIQDAHGNSIELANGIITIKGVGMVRIDAPSVTINSRLVLPVGPPI